MGNKKTSTFLLDYGIVGILIVLVIIFSFASENFMKVNTIFTILKQISITGIISIGMCFVILTGGIDLSVGSIAGVSSVTAAMLMMAGVPAPLACVATVLIGFAYGTINGTFITRLGMPPLICTLGMMTSLRGMAFIVTGGLPVFGFSQTFGDFAKNSLWVIPYPVILLAAIFIIARFVLSRTTVGRHIYGVGGNAEASRLSGINVSRITTFAYSLSGFLSGIAGLVLLSRTNSGQPSSGQNYEMDAITAVVLGGVSLSGGQGNISLVLVGVLIMGILTTGMQMCNINDYVQQLVKGLVLIAAVAFASISKRIQTKLTSKAE
ncbi:MAG: ABC transporter permease [Treponema sp.]|jgi:ribose/xylose/arabinose/galactoside ABC-type transport system permease subunit|nr:ABC transporter permease [Treponema sp.]